MKAVAVTDYPREGFDGLEMSCSTVSGLYRTACVSLPRSLGRGLKFSPSQHFVSSRTLGVLLGAARVCRTSSFSPQLRPEKYDLGNVPFWIILVS